MGEYSGIITIIPLYFMKWSISSVTFMLSKPHLRGITRNNFILPNGLPQPDMGLVFPMLSGRN